MAMAGGRSVARGAFWASAGFYGLVALEFFYMVSPFAAYVYGVYGPGLDGLIRAEQTSWLVGFFLPHIVRETQSPLVTWHEPAGVVLLVVGLGGFIAGAVQIYAPGVAALSCPVRVRHGVLRVLRAGEGRRAGLSA
jgi:hypothetical protein